MFEFDDKLTNDQCILKLEYLKVRIVLPIENVFLKILLFEIYFKIKQYACNKNSKNTV